MSKSILFNTTLMNRIGSLSLVFGLICTQIISAQSGLAVQDRSNPSKIIPIKFKRNYAFETDSLGVWKGAWHGRIHSHDQLSIELITHSDQNIELALNSIRSIERPNFYSSASTVSLFSAAYCLFGAPIVWALQGGDAALNYLAGVGLSIAIFIPCHFLSQKFRYDMRSDYKWLVIPSALQN